MGYTQAVVATDLILGSKLEDETDDRFVFSHPLWNKQDLFSKFHPKIPNQLFPWQPSSTGKKVDSDSDDSDVVIKAQPTTKDLFGDDRYLMSECISEFGGATEQSIG